MKKQVNDIRSNPVPIGFIYVQLPNQPTPSTIWSNVKWEEVTSQYSNLFFRAQGDKTEEFGKVQLEAAPRLDKVNITIINWENDSKWLQYHSNLQDVISPGKWSKLLYTGLHSWKESLHQYINFLVSDEEIRPKNMAIKIWKRTQ